jgi:hypothetical protein
MGRNRLTHLEFEDRTVHIYGRGKFNYLRKYKGMEIKILIECLNCGYEFWETPEKHLYGDGCNNCEIKYRRVLNDC